MCNFFRGLGDDLESPTNHLQKFEMKINRKSLILNTVGLERSKFFT